MRGRIVRPDRYPTQLRLTSDGKLAIEKLLCRLVGTEPIAPTEQLVNFVGIISSANAIFRARNFSTTSVVAGTARSDRRLPGSALRGCSFACGGVQNAFAQAK
jgi:hypothetical protein